jgi:hypothetical protein
MPSDTSSNFNPILSGSDYPETLINGLAKVIDPPMFARIDIPAFIRSFVGSFSLSLVEKERVFQATATLSKFQFDSLQEVWEDEKLEFGRLVANEWQQVAQLSAKSWIEANMLANSHSVGFMDAANERAALQHMLVTKYNSAARRKWVIQALSNSDNPLLHHVFGAMPGISDMPNGVRSTPSRVLKLDVPDVC